MERALVVVEPTEPSRDLLREAGEIAAGVDADLVVLSTLTEEEYERDREVLETIANEENTAFPVHSVAEHAESAAASVANEALSDVDVTYETKGVARDEKSRGTAIVDAAEAADCDHVFLTGVRRSPTGKAVFGDATQSVILNFDGRTTVSMAEQD